MDTLPIALPGDRADTLAQHAASHLAAFSTWVNQAGFTDTAARANTLAADTNTLTIIADGILRKDGKGLLRTFRTTNDPMSDATLTAIGSRIGRGWGFGRTAITLMSWGPDRPDDALDRIDLTATAFCVAIGRTYQGEPAGTPAWKAAWLHNGHNWDPMCNCPVKATR